MLAGWCLWFLACAVVSVYVVVRGFLLVGLGFMVVGFDCL